MNQLPRTGLALIGLALAGALALTACAPAAPLPGRTASPGGDDVVTIDPVTQHIELERGQILLVWVGEVNASIGDQWSIAQQPEPEVLGFQGETYTPDDPTGLLVGSGGTLSYAFIATGPGETELMLQYEYRGEAPEGVEGEPRVVTVTVE